MAHEFPMREKLWAILYSKSFTETQKAQYLGSDLPAQSLHHFKTFSAV